MDVKLKKYVVLIKGLKENIDEEFLINVQALTKAEAKNIASIYFKHEYPTEVFIIVNVYEVLK